MPLYEYRCSKCKHKFELLKRLSECSNDAVCPVCKGKSKRIISMFSAFSSNSQGLTSSVSGSSCGSCATPSGCGT